MILDNNSFNDHTTLKIIIGLERVCTMLRTYYACLA